MLKSVDNKDIKKNFALNEELDFDFDTVWKVLLAPATVLEERGKL